MTLIPKVGPFSPRLESLEAREVPAVLLNVVDHTLHIIGDQGAQVIHIADNGHGTIHVSAGDEHLTATDIHRIAIDTHAGNDTVDYKLTGKLAKREAIVARLGAGDDKASFNFLAGVNDDGHLNFNLFGGKGNDRESVKIGSIARGGSAVIHIHEAKGNDSVYFHAVGNVGGRLVATISGDHKGDHDHIATDVHLGAHGHVNVSVW